MSKEIRTVCQWNTCAGCMACVDICAKNAIRVQDDLMHYNAMIDQQLCVNCGACHNVCQKNNPPKAVKPQEWFQGWAKDADIRSASSSGGLATVIARDFIQDGGAVYACEFAKGEFIFSKATNESDVYRFQGSKYVKSNPIGTYRAIVQDLKKGMKVLFIGLPCQVAAVKNFVDHKWSDNLYTIDLICHGTPSPNILDLFLYQYHRPLSEVSHIAFRKKDQYQIYLDHKPIVTKGIKDAYTIAFLRSLICTENCYECRYAALERVSDITLGDARGSDLPRDITMGGVSLVLCQTQKGKDLIRNIPVEQIPIGLQQAIAHNNQLSAPPNKPKQRQMFFDKIRKNKSFNALIFRIYPKVSCKQIIKKLLIWLRII